MPSSAALATAVVAALALGGCVLPEHQEKGYQGQVTGYSPTPSFLKVNVRDADGAVTLFDFDRRDWYTAEVARRVDERTVKDLTIHGVARETIGEILVLDVLDPSQLSALRYDKMDATPEARQAMDDEYDAILHPLRDPMGDAPSKPDLTVPPLRGS